MDQLSLNTYHAEEWTFVEPPQHALKRESRSGNRRKLQASRSQSLPSQIISYTSNREGIDICIQVDRKAEAKGKLQVLQQQR